MFIYVYVFIKIDMYLNLDILKFETKCNEVQLKQELIYAQ
jgi:hypothetical protein